MKTGKKPLFSVDMVEALLSNSQVATDKARRELGYSARPIRESIRDTVLWLRQAGY